MRILIVEDEKPIADGLQFNFQEEGYEVIVKGDGPSALEMIDSHEPFSLVVLDLMLPGMSGYEVCKEIRTRDAMLPVMVLSAKESSQDKAYAFDCGASQYVTKPFDLQEVLSRVRNLIKSNEAQSTVAMSASSNGNRFEFDSVVVDCEQFQVEVDGVPNALTTMEMQLLRYFLNNEGKVLSRAQIMENVWDQSARLTTRSIDNFVMRLRKIIEPDPSQPRYILSIRGTGYRFVLPGDEAKHDDS